MIPQSSSVPMDAETADELSLPPDICIKVSNTCNESPEISNISQRVPGTSWPGDDLPNLRENAAAVAFPVSTAGNSKGAVGGTLPDLCEGANSRTTLNGVEEEKQPQELPASAAPKAHTGGAKPKIKNFKYKVNNNKSKHSSLDSKHGARTIGADIERTNKKKNILGTKSDNIQKEKSPSVQLEKNISSTCDKIEIDSNCDKNVNKEHESKLKCDSGLKINSPSEDPTKFVENIEEKNVGTREPTILPAEDYLLYDSRPIGLLSCGIWDCDSEQSRMESDKDVNSGLMLVRNNLQTASHPMFSKWPCEAYIPSHYLVEVTFNSHGTSMGHAGSPGLHLYGSYNDADGSARENEQIKLAKRMGLMQHLPQGTVDAGTAIRECVICFNDLNEGERVRYLPCMHLYHTECIDDWFQRSFTCPSCLEPVDAALLNTYNTT